MRYAAAVLLLSLVVLCSAPVWADSIANVVDINATATFVGTQCSSCIETITMNLIYTQPQPGGSSPGASAFGQIDSATVSSSGFLGIFSTYPGTVPWIPGQGYFPVTNGLSDEIDIYGFGIGAPMPLGIDTMNFDLFYCRSAACDAAYGLNSTQLHPTPITEYSSVTARQVPDGDSSLLLMLVALVPIGVAYRWRGQGRACPLV